MTPNLLEMCLRLVRELNEEAREACESSCMTIVPFTFVTNGLIAEIHCLGYKLWDEGDGTLTNRELEDGR
mgnify:CR=1 FL=1